jgi:hypothetical protein
MASFSLQMIADPVVPAKYYHFLGSSPDSSSYRTSAVLELHMCDKRVNQAWGRTSTVVAMVASPCRSRIRVALSFAGNVLLGTMEIT